MKVMDKSVLLAQAMRFCKPALETADSRWKARRRIAPNGFSCNSGPTFVRAFSTLFGRPKPAAAAGISSQAAFDTNACVGLKKNKLIDS